MRQGFLFGDLPSLDKEVHVCLVFGKLFELISLYEHVAAAVTDAAGIEGVVTDESADKRGSHAFGIRVVLRVFVDERIGFLGHFGEPASVGGHEVVFSLMTESVDEGFDGDLRSKITFLGATHAIADDEEDLAIGVHGDLGFVIVMGSDFADIRFESV